MAQPTTVQLTRTVRFALAGDGSLRSDQPVRNGYAGWPPMTGLGRFFQLHVTCRGRADPHTGYFINIKHIDQAVRDHSLPIVADAAGQPDPPMGRLMRRLVESLDAPLQRTVRSLSLQLTPTYALTLEADAMDHVLISQQFDFSAAHRLHTESLSDEKNRDVFGKCNNPNGHGHNYRLEVSVRCPIDSAGHVRPVADLDALVDRLVIERFDHKHLNLDTREFAELNPSVEHIARVCYELLHDPVADKLGAELKQVRIWETEKTACSYPG